MTPFSFKKLQYEYEKSKDVRFLSEADGVAITYSNGGNGHTVTENSCSCIYFSAMALPCRHLLHFLTTNELAIFAPDLCAERWTRTYYYNSHPALHQHQQVAAPLPTSFAKPKIQSEIQKYRKAATITKDINNIVSNMGTAEFNVFYEKLKDFRNEIILPSPNITNTTSSASTSTHLLTTSATIISSAMPTTTSAIISSATFLASTTTDLPNRSATITSSAVSTSSTATISPTTSTIPSTITPTVVTPMSDNDSADLSLPNVPSSNVQPYRVIFPPKVTSVGRPKGSGQTVIGLKRKNKTKKDEPKRSTNAHNLTKFVDLNTSQQASLLVSWLTNKSLDDFKSSKITMGDIIQDWNMFNRLRNDGVDLKCVKGFMQPKCFQYLRNEVERLKTERWACSKCKKTLSGFQLMCNGCLDWFHISCVGVSEQKAATLIFFCSSCTQN